MVEWLTPRARAAPASEPASAIAFTERNSSHESAISGSRGRSRSEAGRGDARRALRKEQALVEPADADEHQAEPDEGEGAEDAGDAAHIQEEDLGYRQQDDGRGGKPCRLGAQQNAREQQRD